MKYFKVFNTENEYLEYIHSEECINPYVITLRDSSNTWISAEVHDYSKDYFTIESLGDGVITFTIKAPITTSELSYMSYSTNNGETWTRVDNVDNEEKVIDVSVSNGDKVLWKGEGLRTAKHANNSTIESASTFSSTCNFNVGGNAMSLLFGDNFTEVTTLNNDSNTSVSNASAFKALFSGCTMLINAEYLVLPATSIARDCYRDMFNACVNLRTPPSLSPVAAACSGSYRAMFSHCSSLATTPQLIATTLQENCYYAMFDYCTSLTEVSITIGNSSTTMTAYGSCKNMFSSCTNLTTVPRNMLPATTLKQGCYKEMFENCTSLTTTPELPATTLVSQCYEGMFQGCTSLTTAPSLPATNISGAGDCYQYMFSGCTSLVSVPSTLPATTLAGSCYTGMFKGCTSLTSAPSLPATTLANSCYSYMFQNCTSLTTAPVLSAATLVDRCYQGMFYGCTSLTSAPSLPATTLAVSCYQYMFNGCTSLVSVPSTLPATTLANNCYQSMFKSCTSLVSVPSTLPATTLVSQCYEGMFQGCTSLTTAPVLSATTMATSACSNMFQDCISLTTAPSTLPATTLANSCYKEMFRNCEVLATAPSLPATTLANNCYQYMFQGCTNLTAAPLLPATTLVSYCYQKMFSDTSKLTSITCLATDISATDCTKEWVLRTSKNGTFTKPSTMTSWTSGNNGIPNGWGVEPYDIIHVTEVTLNTGSMEIITGNTYQLTATVSPNDAYDKSVTWSSNDTSIATVDSNGLVTAVGCGNATITVTTTDGGLTAQCATSVINPVTGVTLDKNTIYVLTGETYQLVATVSPSDACGDKSVTWSTSDSSVATVSSEGVVTAGSSSGSAVVTVTTTVGSYTASCAVKVTEPVAVTGVTLDESTLDITVGQTRQLTATVLPSNATDKAVIWSSDDTSIATVTSEGVVSGVTSGTTDIIVTTHDGGYTASCEITVSVPVIATLAIVGAPNISAETCTYNAIADNSEDVTSSATWSITSGSQYATINSSNGTVTILTGASESSVTIQAVYGGLTATSTVTLTYVSGATSETETESTTDIGGNVTTVATTITTYEDGSSVEASKTTVTDVNGDVVGTSESNTTTNVDGSYNGNTTNYDASGNPTDGSNVTGDTAGNVSTQSVVYDASGNTVVTGYDIDTSETTGKTFNGDGANTEYYAFDVTHGFELEMHFTVDCSNKPSGQHQNHHNILTAKRATPEPWYGFQLRQTGTNKYIQLGTQFNTGTNTNTQINPASITGSVAEYSLKIIYNPTLTANTFICRDMINNTDVYTSDGIFPDLEALRYLKVLIGYAVDGNENPYRYSDINVFNFSLKKLKNVANPTISCSENVVTIACVTANSDIYYRLNLSGEYSAYTSTFTITADTVVQAYAVTTGSTGDTSDIVEQNCIYVNVIATPTISCDGEEVTITCATAGADIYYRLNESGSYSAYTAVIPITADTVVEAYAELNGYTSHTAKQTCYYVEGVDEPVITCDGKHVTITCDTYGADILYRLNETGTYSAYTTPIKITATTVVESYASLAGYKTSEVVKQTCTYDPTPDYRWEAADINEEWVCSGDDKHYKEYYQISYDGGDTWENVSTEQTRTGELYEAESEDCIDFKTRYFTIESLENSNAISLYVHSSATGNTAYYSTDSGSTWTAIASGSGSKTIATINSGQTIWLKATSSTSGQQAKWATDYNKNSYFNATKTYKVYGNAMSLLVGDDFATADTITQTFALCGLFFGGNNSTKLINAKNLVLPATGLTVSSYNGMFRGCKALQYGPKLLPALVVPQDGYSSMFESGTSLVEAPEIMATTVSGNTALNRMFCMARSGQVAASLTKGPVLRITNPSAYSNCYQQLFAGNDSITEVTILAEGTNLSFANWLRNVPASGVIKKKSTTTLTSGGSGLPSGWSTQDID